MRHSVARGISRQKLRTRAFRIVRAAHPTSTLSFTPHRVCPDHCKPDSLGTLCAGTPLCCVDGCCAPESAHPASDATGRVSVVPGRVSVVWGAAAGGATAGMVSACGACPFIGTGVLKTQPPVALLSSSPCGGVVRGRGAAGPGAWAGCGGRGALNGCALTAGTEALQPGPQADATTTLALRESAAADAVKLRVAGAASWQQPCC